MAVINLVSAHRLAPVVLVCLLWGMCASCFAADDSSSDRSKRVYRPPSASSSETRQPEPKPEPRSESKPESQPEPKPDPPKPAPDTYRPPETEKPAAEAKQEHVIRTREPEPKKSEPTVRTEPQQSKPQYRPPTEEPGAVVVRPQDPPKQTDTGQDQGSAQYRPEPSRRGSSAVEHTINKRSGGDTEYQPSGKPGRVTHYIRTDAKREPRRSHYYYDYYPYVEVREVIVEPYPEVVYVDRPVYEAAGYYLENSRLSPVDQGLADIRAAFLIGRFDLISNYVRDDGEIAVMFDGNYEYSLAGRDYLDMTYNALQTMQTTGFVWESVRHRSDGAVTGFATHSYYEPLLFRTTDDTELDPHHSAFASFTLKMINGRARLIEVGVSGRPGP